MAAQVYRAIVIFSAQDDKEAKAKATASAKASGGKVDRLTVRRETWGSVGEEGAPQS